jgi:hypothetical protein
MGGWVYATIGKVKVPCAIMWFASAVVGILSLFGVLPKSVCLLAFAMGIWLLVTFWLKANPHLILRLSTNFDVWYMTANSVLSLVGLVDIFRGDARVVFVAGLWLSTMTVIWFDAGHVTAKRGCVLGNIVGIIVIITFIAGLQFGLFHDLNVRTIGLTLSNVKVSVNNVAFVNERLATVLLFFCKNVYTAVRHPGCYVNLKARLTHEKLSCGELRQRLQENASSSRDVASLNLSSKPSRFQSLLKLMPGVGSRRSRKYSESPAKITSIASKSGDDNDDGGGDLSGSEMGT